MRRVRRYNARGDTVDPFQYQPEHLTVDTMSGYRVVLTPSVALQSVTTMVPGGGTAAWATRFRITGSS
jgi:hypothetical protein